LFVERAKAASPGFELTAQNGPWVAEICRRLDGLPLAIELAAARLRSVSIQQIAERLDDRFRLLTSRLRTAPQRHQALEATLDWSYQLLSEEEQTVLKRLSVFASGWHLEAAEHVCAGGSVAPEDVMDHLSNLVDKSLVVADSSQSRMRYHLLETIRQYARHKLAESGEAGAVRDRHLDYFRQWVEMGAEQLTGPDQPRWLERFAAEHDNLRFALDFSQTNETRQEQGLQLARACAQFWRLRGYLSEGRERLTSALRLPGAQERSVTRVNALLWAANLAYIQSDYAATRRLVEEGLAISREIGAEGVPGVARSLELLGELATEEGDYSAAPGFFEEALVLYRDLQDQRGIADMLMQLGWAAMRAGDYTKSEALLTECLALFREIREAARISIGLAGLGELAVRQRRYERANELLEESLALRRELGERWGTAVTLGSLGWAALLQHDFERMRARLRESLAIRQEIGDMGGIAWCMEKLAEGILVEAQPLPTAHKLPALQRSAQIFGAAAGLREQLNSVIDPADLAQYEHCLKELDRAMGKAGFDAAWQKGRNLALQTAVDLALTPAVTPETAADLSRKQAEKARFGGLTARERQAAILIARGKTNREIAETMTVRLKTVETYVTRILNKLGFESRVQIATWAVEVGLSGYQDDAQE
jgi:DNA-binding CsgD family transcriptional regulator